MEANVIIVAGGSGERFGLKKQFITLGDIPVIRRAADCFDAHPLIKAIVIVVPAEDLSRTEKIMEGVKSRLIITAGGKTRRDSVWNGLKVLPSKDPVLIHDGVRPFVPEPLIERVLQGLKSADACIPGIAETDTIKEIEGGFVRKTIPRQTVYRIQTPQAFGFDCIMNAHSAAADSESGNITDDSLLVELAGGKVRLVQGDPYNIKITLKEDRYIAEAILQCHTESA